MSTSILTASQVADERLATMARVFQRADRVLSAQRVTCTVSHDTYNSAPAWSNGADITFNAAHIGSVTSVDDIIKVTGLNYHELSHVLFTPRNNTSLVREVRAKGLFRAFNMLEDQRIETLLVAKYPSTKPFFVTCFMRYLLANKQSWERCFPLAHGRKYLPLDVRQQVQARYRDQSVVADFVRVIDEYRTLSFPRDDVRGLALLFEYNALLNKATDDAQPDGDPFGHVSASAQRPDVTEGKPEQHDKTADKAKAQSEASDEQPGNESTDEEDDASKAMDDAQDAEDADDFDDDTDDEDDDADGSGSGSDDEDDDTDDDYDDEDGDDSDEDDDWDDDDLDGDRGGDQQAGSDVGDVDGDGSEGDGGADSDGEQGTKPGSGAGAGNAQQPGMPEPMDDDDFDDLLRKAAEKAEQDPDVQQDARTKQSTIVQGDGDTMTSLDQQRYLSNPLPADLLASARKFGKQLARLRDDIDPGWHREQSSGRLNVGRAMRGDDLDTVFDRWDEGFNEAADIECVILLDYSDSMANMMDAASQSMWAIKRSFEEVGGKVTVIGYSDGATLMYDGTQKVERTSYKRFSADGGTQPGKALNQAMRVLHNSKRQSKYLISITDGAWWSDETYSIDRLNQAGVVTAMLYLMAPPYPGRPAHTQQQIDAMRTRISWQGHKVQHVAQGATDIAGFAVALVKERLRQGKLRAS